MTSHRHARGSAPACCPQRIVAADGAACGEPLARVAASDFDEVGPRTVDLACPNGHRVSMRRVEIADDESVVGDVDPDPAA